VWITIHLRHRNLRTYGFGFSPLLDVRVIYDGLRDRPGWISSTVMWICNIISYLLRYWCYWCKHGQVFFLNLWLASAPLSIRILSDVCPRLSHQVFICQLCHGRAYIHTGTFSSVSPLRPSNRPRSAIVPTYHLNRLSTPPGQRTFDNVRVTMYLLQWIIHYSVVHCQWSEYSVVVFSHKMCRPQGWESLHTIFCVPCHAKHFHTSGIEVRLTRFAFWRVDSPQI
jgi:hypothetical protein